MKIKGLKAAVGDYKRANKGGSYSLLYGNLMFDKESGKIWVDELCDLGHNSYVVYATDTIINLGKMMSERHIEINMKTIKEFIHNNFEGFDD